MFQKTGIFFSEWVQEIMLISHKRALLWYNTFIWLHGHREVIPHSRKIQRPVNMLPLYFPRWNFIRAFHG